MIDVLGTSLFYKTSKFYFFV